MKRSCYYHAGCPDGFGAAWAAWRAWGDSARYLPRGHDDPLQARQHAGELVTFVDIAPPNDALRELARVAARLVVLDHHVSARDRYLSQPSLVNAVEAEGHLMHFDLEHSGAILAWQHFHPGEPAPEILRYVEDQDLWNWKLPRSEEVNAALGTYPREFEVWERLSERGIEDLAAEGEHIVRGQRADVERSLASAHVVRVLDRRAEAVNARQLRAPIGHELAKRAAFGEPWGIVYTVTGMRVDASIYSIGDLDVSRVAGRFGGGGHRNASGFSVSLKRWIEEFL